MEHEAEQECLVPAAPVLGKPCLRFVAWTDPEDVPVVPSASITSAPVSVIESVSPETAPNTKIRRTSGQPRQLRRAFA